MRLTRRDAIGGAVAGATIVKGGEAAAVAREVDMERVNGIGGFFFRAKDPGALASWYDQNLGVGLAAQSYEAEPWRTEAGVTVFSPFELAADYFGDWRLQWMINFRVRDLDRMVAQLRANNVAVEVDPQTYPNGRFARLTDPEGNPIALWQPAGGAVSR
jgi:predicted enzyme related to lactoylglutathione lyase